MSEMIDFNSFIAGLIVGNFATTIIGAVILSKINKKSGPKF